MNVKEIRKKLNLTQKEFSDKYNISIRTLQEWEQGRSNPPSYLLNLLSKEYKPSSLKIDNNYPFYICTKKHFLNCDKIYPIQQNKINIILDSLINKDNINKIIVFGSSVTHYCHVGSDVDLYVDMVKNISYIDKKNINFELDLWTNFTCDKNLLNEIEKTGVIIYER